MQYWHKINLDIYDVPWYWTQLQVGQIHYKDTIKSKLHNKATADIRQSNFGLDKYYALRARTKLPVREANPPNKAPTIVVKIIKLI